MKRMIVGASLSAALLLAGCGEESATEPNTEAKAEDKTEAAAPEKTEAVKEESNVEKTEAGEKTTYFTNKAVGEKTTLGPINFSVNKIQTSRLKVANAYKEAFGDKDEVTLVVVDVTAENTSDDTINFHPNQATITTNTGEQVDAEIFLSDEVGGEFIGKVKKEGNIFFVAQSDPKEITSIKYIVDGPSDANFENLAERYTVEIPTK
ncbi:DUF4352 domain-containing protein [Exiguobacterium oxidotolerans]|uniref:DUF4352 domain-containing protein n=1 Tax=Exiguobacterium oxidotolerans TaxID=223958 RepID=UPI000493BA6D|nr:DUF4352 domain-containing protein [Exiguobacterium oxidotolerans]